MQINNAIQKIAIHKKPDADAGISGWLLKKWGEDMFPGVSQAKFVIWPNNGTPDGRSVEEWIKDGILPVDCGGRGPFNHEPKSEFPNDCAATLVAKALGVNDDPALEPILRFALNSDKGNGHLFDIGYLVKEFSDPGKAINWLFTALNVKYQRQLEFFNETRQEFEAKVKIEEVQSGNKIFNLAVVSDSKNEQIGKFARSKHGCEAGLVIQQWPSGNTQIFTNQKLGLTLYDVTAMMRCEEQKMAGKLVVTNWDLLTSDGVLEKIPEWYFHEQGQTLFNGSLTALKISPTRIPLDRIVELVKIGINPDYFPKECRGWCIKKECGFYVYGLHRCKKIRAESYQKR